jgi:hypothetical protein
VHESRHGEQQCLVVGQSLGKAGVVITGDTAGYLSAFCLKAALQTSFDVLTPAPFSPPELCPTRSYRAVPHAIHADCGTDSDAEDSDKEEEVSQRIVSCLKLQGDVLVSGGAFVRVWRVLLSGDVEQSTTPRLQLLYSTGVLRDMV